MRSAALATGLFLLCSSESCSGTDPDLDEEPPLYLVAPNWSTKQAAGAAGPLVVDGRWLAFGADEATSGAAGADLNGDGDMTDAVATVVDMKTHKETLLGVAVRDFVVLGDEIYLVVDEAEDGFDWTGEGGLGQGALLHWSEAAGAVTLVMSLHAGAPLSALVVGEHLYVEAAGSGSGAFGALGLSTTLHLLTADAPTAPQPVPSVDGTFGLPRLLAQRQGLVLLALEEEREGTDLNGDSDTTDTVLALLDGTDPAAAIRSTGLAIAAQEPIFEALQQGPSGWLVAFLVPEADQGGANLNDPALFPPDWQPAQCLGYEDADASDQILFAIDFFAWFADPLSHPPVNTGIAGRERVFALAHTSLVVGTISAEAEAGGCPLNGDGDADDRVARWAQVHPTLAVLGDPERLLALADVPSDSSGIAIADGRLATVVSEQADGRDHDGAPGSDRDLLAWIDPDQGLAASWVFNHDDPTYTASSEFDYVEVNWLSEALGRDYALATIDEAFWGYPANHFDQDADQDDVFPVVIRFEPEGEVDMVFAGYPVATLPTNPGLTVRNDYVLFRVSEAAENVNFSKDPDYGDAVLLKYHLDQGNLRYVSLLNKLPGDAAVTDGVSHAAFLADEAHGIVDYNQDGDKDDLVVRYTLL